MFYLVDDVGDPLDPAVADHVREAVVSALA